LLEHLAKGKITQNGAPIIQNLSSIVEIVEKCHLWSKIKKLSNSNFYQLEWIWQNAAKSSTIVKYGYNERLGGPLKGQPFRFDN